jgi:hypothetical protein
VQARRVSDRQSRNEPDRDPLDKVGTNRSASRAVFQQFDVPKKIIVGRSCAMLASARLLASIGKFGLESSVNERLGASVKSVAARAVAHSVTTIPIRKAASSDAKHTPYLMAVRVAVQSESLVPFLILKSSFILRLPETDSPR